MMLLGKLKEIGDLIKHCEPIVAIAGNYRISAGVYGYPLLGLRGSVNQKEKSVLHCFLDDSKRKLIEDRCLNGVIRSIRVSRVMHSATMTILASDLISEFEVAQVPYMTDNELENQIRIWDASLILTK